MGSSDQNTVTRDEALLMMQQELDAESKPGEWFLVDQPMIDKFVSLSGEDHWSHIDPARARASKFGDCIAPGNMGIALLPKISRATSMYARYPRNYSLNQGWDKIRFLSPLVAGSRIRAKTKLISAQERPDGSIRVAVQFIVEIEDQPKPWFTATKVGRFFYS